MAEEEDLNWIKSMLDDLNSSFEAHQKPPDPGSASSNSLTRKSSTTISHVDSDIPTGSSHNQTSEISTRTEEKQHPESETSANVSSPVEDKLDRTTGENEAEADEQNDLDDVDDSPKKLVIDELRAQSLLFESPKKLVIDESRTESLLDESPQKLVIDELSDLENSLREISKEDDENTAEDEEHLSEPVDRQVDCEKLSDEADGSASVQKMQESENKVTTNDKGESSSQQDQIAEKVNTDFEEVPLPDETEKEVDKNCTTSLSVSSEKEGTGEIPDAVTKCVQDPQDHVVNESESDQVSGTRIEGAVHKDSDIICLDGEPAPEPKCSASNTKDAAIRGKMEEKDIWQNCDFDVSESVSDVIIVTDKQITEKQNNTVSNVVQRDSSQASRSDSLKLTDSISTSQSPSVKMLCQQNTMSTETPMPIAPKPSDQTSMNPTGSLIGGSVFMPPVMTTAAPLYQTTASPFQTLIQPVYTKPSLKPHSRNPNVVENFIRAKGTGPFLCDFCGFKTGDRATIAKHKAMKTCQKEVEISSKIPTFTFCNGMYTCSGCNFSTQNRKLFTVHVCLHLVPDPCRCHYCSYSTRQLLDINRHTLLSHPKKKCTWQIAGNGLVDAIMAKLGSAAPLSNTTFVPAPSTENTAIPAPIIMDNSRAEGEEEDDTLGLKIVSVESLKDTSVKSEDIDALSSVTGHPQTGSLMFSINNSYESESTQSEGESSSQPNDGKVELHSQSEGNSADKCNLIEVESQKHSNDQPDEEGSLIGGGGEGEHGNQIASKQDMINSPAKKDSAAKKVRCYLNRGIYYCEQTAKPTESMYTETVNTDNKVSETKLADSSANIEKKDTAKRVKCYYKDGAFCCESCDYIIPKNNKAVFEKHLFSDLHPEGTVCGHCHKTRQAAMQAETCPMVDQVMNLLLQQAASAAQSKETTSQRSTDDGDGNLSQSSKKLELKEVKLNETQSSTVSNLDQQVQLSEFLEKSPMYGKDDESPEVTTPEETNESSVSSENLVPPGVCESTSKKETHSLSTGERSDPSYSNSTDAVESSGRDSVLSESELTKNADVLADAKDTGEEKSVTKEPDTSVMSKEPDTSVMSKEPDTSVMSKEPDTSVMSKDQMVSQDKKDERKKQVGKKGSGPRSAKLAKMGNKKTASKVLLKCIYEDGKFQCRSCSFSCANLRPFHIHVWKDVHRPSMVCNHSSQPKTKQCPIVKQMMDMLIRKKNESRENENNDNENSLETDMKSTNSGADNLILDTCEEEKVEDSSSQLPDTIQIESKAIDKTDEEQLISSPKHNTEYEKQKDKSQPASPCGDDKEEDEILTETRPQDESNQSDSCDKIDEIKPTSDHGGMSDESPSEEYSSNVEAYQQENGDGLFLKPVSSEKADHTGITDPPVDEDTEMQTGENLHSDSQTRDEDKEQTVSVVERESNDSSGTDFDNGTNAKDVCSEVQQTENSDHPKVSIEETTPQQSSDSISMEGSTSVMGLVLDTTNDITDAQKDTAATASTGKAEESVNDMTSPQKEDTDRKATEKTTSKKETPNKAVVNQLFVKGSKLVNLVQKAVLKVKQSRELPHKEYQLEQVEGETEKTGNISSEESMNIPVGQIAHHEGGSSVSSQLTTQTDAVNSDEHLERSNVLSLDDQVDSVPEEDSDGVTSLKIVSTNVLSEHSFDEGNLGMGLHGYDIEQNELVGETGLAKCRDENNVQDTGALQANSGLNNTEKTTREPKGRSETTDDLINVDETEDPHKSGADILKSLLANDSVSTAGDSSRTGDTQTKGTPPKKPSLETYDASFICSITSCNVITTNPTGLKAHMKFAHKNVDSFPCVYCSFKSPSIDQYVRHISLHGQTQNAKKLLLYRCAVEGCDYSTGMSEEFNNHNISVHSTVQEFRCWYCEKIFQENENLMKHLEVNVMRAVLCPYCKVTVKYRRQMLHHLGTVHPNEQKRILVGTKILCKKEAENRPGLLKIPAVAAPPLSCPKCNYTNPVKRLLANHILECARSAPPSSSFTCPFCREKLSSHQELLSHSQWCGQRHVRVIRKGVIRKGHSRPDVGMGSGSSEPLKLPIKIGVPYTLPLDLSTNNLAQTDTQNEAGSAASHTHHSDHTDSSSKVTSAARSRKSKPLAREWEGNPIEYVEETPTPEVEEYFDCSKCPYETLSIDNLKKHVQRHNALPDKKKHFLCKHCGYGANSSAIFIYHMAFHKESSRVRVYNCPYCLFASNQMSLVEEHLDEVHPSEDFRYEVTQKMVETKVFSCSYCDGGNFQGVLSLWKHMQESHGNEKLEEFQQGIAEEDTPPYDFLVAATDVGNRRKSCKPGKQTKTFALSAEKSSAVSADQSSVETTKGRLACRFCPFTINSIVRFTTHVAAHLSVSDTMDVNMYQCKACRLTSTSNRLIREHGMKTHRSKVPSVVIKSIKIKGTMPNPNYRPQIDSKTVEEDNTATPVSSLSMQIDRYHCDHCFFSTNSIKTLSDHVSSQHTSFSVQSQEETQQAEPQEINQSNAGQMEGVQEQEDSNSQEDSVEKSVLPDIPHNLSPPVLVPEVPIGGGGMVGNIHLAPILIRKPGSKKLWKCPYCYHDSAKKSNIDRHIEHVHVNKKIKGFACAYCEYECNSKFNISYHQKKYHAGRPLKHQFFDRSLPVSTIPTPVKGKTVTPIKLKIKLPEFKKSPPKLKLETTGAMVPPKEPDITESIQPMEMEVNGHMVHVPEGSLFKVPQKCPLCDYLTKVRSNFVRHLKQHQSGRRDSTSEKIGETDPHPGAVNEPSPDPTPTGQSSEQQLKTDQEKSEDSAAVSVLESNEAPVTPNENQEVSVTMDTNQQSIVSDGRGDSTMSARALDDDNDMDDYNPADFADSPHVASSEEEWTPAHSKRKHKIHSDIIQAEKVTIDNKEAYKCPECDFTARFPSKVRRHCDYKHIHYKHFRCGYCDFDGVEKGKVRRHCRIMHRNLSPKIIMLTNNESGEVQESALEEDNQTDDLPLDHGEQSPDSGETENYSESSDLSWLSQCYAKLGKNHLRCNYCSYKQEGSSSMRRHVLAVHLDFYPYKCKYCDFVAVEKNKIIKHIHAKHAGASLRIIIRKWKKKLPPFPGQTEGLDADSDDNLEEEFITQAASKSLISGQDDSEENSLQDGASETVAVGNVEKSSSDKVSSVIDLSVVKTEKTDPYFENHLYDKEKDASTEEVNQIKATTESDQELKEANREENYYSDDGDDDGGGDAQSEASEDQNEAVLNQNEASQDESEAVDQTSVSAETSLHDSRTSKDLEETSNQTSNSEVPKINEKSSPSTRGESSKRKQSAPMRYTPEDYSFEPLPSAVKRLTTYTGSPKKLFGCSFCEYTSKYGRQDTMRHIIVNHLKQHPYKCGVCDKGLQKACAIDEHWRRFHMHAGEPRKLVNNMEKLNIGLVHQETGLDIYGIVNEENQAALELSRNVSPARSTTPKSVTQNTVPKPAPSISSSISRTSTPSTSSRSNTPRQQQTDTESQPLNLCVVKDEPVDESSDEENSRDGSDINPNQSKKIFECIYCGYQSKWCNSDVRKHISMVHLRMYPFKCMYCPYQSMGKIKMKKHWNSLHQSQGKEFMFLHQDEARVSPLRETDDKVFFGADPGSNQTIHQHKRLTKVQQNLYKDGTEYEGPVAGSEPHGTKQTSGSPVDTLPVVQVKKEPDAEADTQDADRTPERTKPYSNRTEQTSSSAEKPVTPSSEQKLTGSSSSSGKKGSCKKQFKCVYCGHASRWNMRDVKKHIYSIHVHQYPFQCGHCTKGAIDKVVMEAHWQRKHPLLPFKFEQTVGREVIPLEEEGDVVMLGVPDLLEDEIHMESRKRKLCGNSKDTSNKTPSAKRMRYDDSVTRDTAVNNVQMDKDILCKESEDEVQSQALDLHVPKKTEKRSSSVISSIHTPVKQEPGDSVKVKLPIRVNLRTPSPPRLEPQPRTLSSPSTRVNDVRSPPSKKGSSFRSPPPTKDSDVRSPLTSPLSNTLAGLALPSNLDKMIEYAMRDNRRVNICKECGYSNMGLYKVRRHCLARHMKLYPFKCKYCEYSSVEKFNILNHVIKHHPGKEFRLVISKVYRQLCPSGSAGKLSSNEEMEEEGNSDDDFVKDVKTTPLKIPKPPFTQVSKESVKTTDSHPETKKIKRNESKSPGGTQLEYPCDYCPYVAFSIDLLRKHQIRHYTYRPYGCYYCKYKAYETKQIRNHIISRHADMEIRIKKFTKPAVLQVRDDFQRGHPTKYEKSPKTNSPQQIMVNGTVVYKCNLCMYKTGSPKCLKIHSSRAHKVPASIVQSNSQLASTKSPTSAAEEGATGKKTTIPKIKLSLSKTKDSKPSSSKPVNTTSSSKTPPSVKTPNTYRCTACGFRFASKGFIAIHVRKHQEYKPFCCGYCGSAHYRRTDAMTHISHQHPNQPIYIKVERDVEIEKNLQTLIEPLTPKVTKPATPQSNQQAQDHEKTSNEAESAPSSSGADKAKKYPCPMCPFEVNSLNKLKMHIRSEIGYKPFHCSGCSFRTVDKVQVEKHMKQVHKGEFVHITVNKSIAMETKIKQLMTRSLKKARELYDQDSTSNLKVIRRNGEFNILSGGSFQCVKCGYVTSKRKHIFNHMVRHGPPRYQCGYCNDYYAIFPFEVENHRKTAHPDKPPNTQRIVATETADDDADDDENGADEMEIKQDEVVKNENESSEIEVIASVEEFSRDDSGNYRCLQPNCDFTSTNKKYMLRHRISHMEEPMFHCLYCNHKSNYRFNMKKHLRSFHQGCEHKLKRVTPSGDIVIEPLLTGGFVLKQPSFTPKPQPRKTSFETIYCCSQCSFKNTKLYLFVEHMEMHLSENLPEDGSSVASDKEESQVPLKCGFCPFVSHQEDAFNRHLETHTFSRPYKCGHCDHTVFHKSKLKDHSQRLHPDLPLLIIDCDNPLQVSDSVSESGSTTGSTLQSRKVVKKMDLNPTVKLMDVFKLPVHEYMVLLTTNGITNFQ